MEKSLATIEEVKAVEVYGSGKMNDLLTGIEEEVKKFIPETETARRCRTHTESRPATAGHMNAPPRTR